MNDLLRNLSDLICLLYHEARNVRHPIKAKKLPQETKYKKLINLPKNRDIAWQQMAKVRDKAANSRNATAVAYVFQEEYCMSLEELLDLYNCPCWKRSPYGGNRWAPICSKIRDLVQALVSGNDILSTHLFEIIPQMKHNTGIVGKKLLELRSGV